MTDIVNLALNSGVAIVVIAFFMYKDIMFSKSLNETLTALEKSVKLIQDYFIDKKEADDDGK